MSPILWDREYDDRFAAAPFVILSGCADVQKNGHVSRGASCLGHISLDVPAFQVFFSHLFISPTYRSSTFLPTIFLVRASVATQISARRQWKLHANLSFTMQSLTKRTKAWRTPRERYQSHRSRTCTPDRLLEMRWCRGNFHTKSN